MNTQVENKPCLSSEMVISIITGIFIYYRKLDYYKTMPRKNFIVSIGIVLWTYLSILNPKWIIVGLVVLNLIGYKHSDI